MELTKWDVSFTTAMVLAVFIMSVVFPYVGIAAGDRATPSDIPTPDIGDWDIGVDQYDRPNRPLGADENRVTVYEGNLTDITIWNSNGSAIQPDEALTLGLEFYGYSNLTEAVLVLENSTNLTQESVAFYGDEIGSTKTANIDDDYIVEVTLEEWEDDALNGKDRYQLRTKVVEISGRQTGSGGLLTWASDLGSDVGRVLLFIGEILVWAVQASIGFAVAATQAGLSFATWMFEISAWLGTGYYTIISVADGWVLGLLFVPLIGLGYEAAKIAIIVIGVLPTT